MILTVIVKAGARETSVQGWRDAGTLVLAIHEPPVDGAANHALCKFIAKKLGIAPSLVAVKRGAGAKVKHISLPDGVDLTKLR